MLLCLAIYTSGNRKYESLNRFLTTNGSQNREILRLAEAIRAKRELDMHADAEGITSPWRREANIFDYAQKVYDMKMPLTKRCYVDAFSHLKAFAGEHLSFASIIERVSADFRTFLLARVSQNSAASYFARFRSVLRLATKEGYLRRNPADEPNIHKVETQPKYLTYDQILQLEKTPCGNAIVRDAFLFSINTGPRHKDIRFLSWSQIKDGSLTFTQSKTDSPEILPLTDSAEAIVKRQPRLFNVSDDNENFIFPPAGNAPG
jgi:integrase/recombinase XerD